jgi:uncharacterized protein YcfL
MQLAVCLVSSYLWRDICGLENPQHRKHLPVSIQAHQSWSLQRVDQTCVGKQGRSLWLVLQLWNSW